MKRIASNDDHEATLGWLDASLESARSEGRTRLVKLLDLVRTEVVFDADAPRNLPSTRVRTEGSALGADRSV